MKIKQLPKQLSNPVTTEYFSVDQAAEYLGVMLATVRNHLTSGKLTTYKFHSLTLVSKKEVRALKERTAN